MNGADEGAGNDITRLLRRAREGDADAEQRLFSLVYEDLRRSAAGLMRRQPRGHTLEPAALVNEAFLRIAGRDTPWVDRAHFFATAAVAMTHVLHDHARRKKRLKHGGGRDRVEFDDDVMLACDDREYESADLRRAIEDLREIDPRAARVVEMKFMAGMAMRAIAKALGCSVATVERDWEFARAWLAERLDA